MVTTSPMPALVVVVLNISYLLISAESPDYYIFKNLAEIIISVTLCLSQYVLNQHYKNIASILFEISQLAFLLMFCFTLGTEIV